MGEATGIISATTIVANVIRAANVVAANVVAANVAAVAANVIAAAANDVAAAANKLSANDDGGRRGWRRVWDDEAASSVVSSVVDGHGEQLARRGRLP